MDNQQDVQNNQDDQKSRSDQAIDAVRKVRSAQKNIQRAKNALDAIKATRAGANAAQGLGQAGSAAGSATGVAGGAGAAAGGAGAAAGGAGATATAGAATAGATAVGGAAAGTVGAGAAATSPVWGTVAAIIIIILVIVVLFVVVFGGGDKANEGATTGDGDYPCPTTCTATCSGTDVPDTNAICENTANLCCVPDTPPVGPGSFHFFCQYTDAYSPRSCDIEGNGCTPTSVAAIIYSLGKTEWNPLKVALANGKKGCFSGSSASDFFAFIRGQGFRVRENMAPYGGTTFHYTKAKERLAQGCFLLSGANMTYRSSGTLHRGNHAFVISAIDSDNIITIQDSTFCRSDSPHETRYMKTNRRDTKTDKIIIYNWWNAYAICP